MIQTMLVVALGAYICLESIKQLADMDGGDRVCRVAKYFLSATSGATLGWLAFIHRVDWLHVALASSVALFVWPKMLTRLHHIFAFERRRGDRRV